jgi:hypothetical protein
MEGGREGGREGRAGQGGKWGEGRREGGRDGDIKYGTKERKEWTRYVLCSPER